MVSGIRRVGEGESANSPQYLRRVREEWKREKAKWEGERVGGGLTTVLLRAQFTGLPPTLCRVLAAAALALRGVESFGH